MIHNIMPGTEEQLAKEQTTAYVGIDPTADSLHIGHLVSVMMMKHFGLYAVFANEYNFVLSASFAIFDTDIDVLSD